MQWLRWVQRIQDIAQTGLAYAKDPYDRERYEQLRALAVEIGAAYLERPSAEVAALIASERGYPTPKVDVRAVVFDDQGRLLFAREHSDGAWSLPGGWADGGSTPGEMAARETWEETGYRVRPVKVLAAWDRDRQGHPPMAFACYKLFIRCELIGGEARPNHEILEVGFFGRDEVPPLSSGRVTLSQVRRMFEHYDAPLLPADFD
jgi:ADP-ribose pyrophosphatase YjhB (NUDIX family)